MNLAGLQDIVNAQGPFASAYLDVSRTEPQAARQVDARWRSVRQQMGEQGAPDGILDLVEERVTAPTGYGGDLGRAVVVSGDGVLLDQLLPRPPMADHGHFGPIAHLWPLVRARSALLTYVLVEADHAGATISYVDGSGIAATSLEAEGGHDVLHKVRGGGLSHRRLQRRAEDSWERNATAVAEELDSLVARLAPAKVFLVGDPHAVSAIHTHASGRVSERLVDLEHGSRAEGTSDDALDREVTQALDRHRTRVRDDVCATFAERVAKDDTVATGFEAVVEALRLGAVETLLLVDHPESTLRLATGPQPLQLGRRSEDVAALGADNIFDDRADEVMLRALIALDGDLVLVDEPPEGMRDGIGALQRFDSRPETPGRG